MSSMFVFRRRKKLERQPVAPSVAIESMEPRRLLSVVLHPNDQVLSYAASNSNVQGYTPDQIRHAYGFDQISFASGASADGAGQTIAIIDAYNDPNIAGDLKVFDSQFGLADAPSLKVVNE